MWCICPEGAFLVFYESMFVFAIMLVVQHNLGGIGLPPVGGDAYGIFVNGSNHAWNAFPRTSYLPETKITRPG